MKCRLAFRSSPLLQVLVTELYVNMYVRYGLWSMDSSPIFSRYLSVGHWLLGGKYERSKPS
jgi:hypothetical protein